MRHKTLKAAAVIAFLATPSLAQDNLALAKQYMSLPAVENMITEMFSGDIMVAQMEANMGGITLSETQKQKLSTLMGGLMTKLRPQVNDAMLKTTAEIMTAEEIKYMIEVYSTPLGASIVGKTAEMMTRSQALMGPAIMEEMMSAMPQIQEIMTSP